MTITTMYINSLLALAKWRSVSDWRADPRARTLVLNSSATEKQTCPSPKNIILSRLSKVNLSRHDQHGKHRGGHSGLTPSPRQ